MTGSTFTDFVTGGEDYAKPYLWPLRAASGTVVTRYWPMDKTHEGESHDHPHHRGLWFGQDEVNGFNFWAGEPSINQKNPGKQVVRNLKVKSGSETGTIQCDIDWTAGGSVLMVEHRAMTFYSGDAAGPQNRQVDFDINAGAEDQGRIWRHQGGHLFDAPRPVAGVSAKARPPRAQADGPDGECGSREG